MVCILRVFGEARAWWSLVDGRNRFEILVIKRRVNQRYKDMKKEISHLKKNERISGRQLAEISTYASRY